MNAKKFCTRAFTLMLVLFVVIGLMPISAMAVVEDSNLEKALSFIDGITVDNSSNDPSTVVSKFGTHFTWDNEKREEGKSYLFDWSYYNGVVFEGIEYLYEVTKDEKYADYVIEYMSSLIAEDGTWATCSNNSSKECAGYNSTHGADCYKTASLLLDAYEMTDDERYLTMAATLYADLDSAASKYSLKNAGNNYRHTWATDPTPDLWLDGLYMILPFRAEYAKYIGDTDELDLIVDRMQWVSDNMYNSSKGLFYHAADSASSNSGTYWLRSMGWYAAAMVDVMDSMDGENLEAMQAQFKKFVDGMKAVQNSSNGMWLNNMNASYSSSNPYETSGTSLVCYAIMKAVNNGWLDASYADMAVLAFNGICNEKLDGDTLTDICFKGAPGSSNSTFFDNEGKGVGPFIMFYAEVLEYVNSQTITGVEVTTEPTVKDYYIDEDAETITLDTAGLVVTATYKNGAKKTVSYNEGSTEKDGYALSMTLEEGVREQTVTVSYAGFEDTFTINVYELGYSYTESGVVIEPTAPGVTGVTVVDNSDDEAVAAALKNVVTSYVSYDINLDGYTQGDKVLVTLPIPEGTVNPVVYYVPDDGSAAVKLDAYIYDDVIVFVADHFSTYAVGDDMGTRATSAASVSGTGNLVGEATYKLDTDGVDNGAQYLIVNRGTDGTGYALRNNNGDATTATVTISNGYATFSNDNYASTSLWTFDADGEYWDIYNNARYIYLGNGSVLSTSQRDNLLVNENTNGSVVIRRDGSRRLYLNGTTYSSSNNSSTNFYLFKYTPGGNGEAVTFTVTPGSATIAPEGPTTLTGTVTVAGETVDLSDCTITWASSDSTKATVSGGTVTGVADGTANITATLSAVDGKALQNNIVLTVPVTVASKKIVGAELLGGPVEVATGKVPDYSGISVKVTYEDEDGDGDGETATFDYKNLQFGDVDTSVEGTHTVTVTYGEWEFELEVIVSAFGGLEPATTYPEYPNPGAVRVDKTATHNADEFKRTGVTNVEIDVAGISYKAGVDVVLTIDLSNSMAWEVGTTTDNLNNNKLHAVIAAVKNFANIFLSGNVDGATNNNTITIVTFGGYDADNFNPTDSSMIDVTRTLVSATDDLDIINAICDGTKFTAVGTYELQLAYYDESTDTVKTVTNNNRGDTNYDFAFWQTEQAIDAGNLGAGDRDVYVLFMTDGCASNYNGIYYRTSTPALMPGTDTNFSGDTDYRTVNNGGEAWTDLILESIGENGGNIYAKRLVSKVKEIYAIGFDMAYGSFSGINDWDTDGIVWSERFNEIVSKSIIDADGNGLIEVTDATDTDTLNNFYTSLASELKLAGTNAVVHDTVGNNFSVQLASYVVDKDGNKITLTIPPTITIKTYDLYPAGSKDEDGNDITGDRTGVSENVEIVSFNNEGTEAYSTLIDNGETNIMTIAEDGAITINAKYFTYTKTKDSVENFVWHIGDITDKEIALAFGAYLDGAMTGERPEDVYYTNEEATVDYIDAFGKHAQQTFPVPGVAWGGATTTIRFYLVNHKGEPVNRYGDVVPWANRVYVGESVVVSINLNLDMSIAAQTVEAAAHVPSGFYLYDYNAYYTIQTTSNNDAITGGIFPSEPSDDAKKTTGTGDNVVTQTGAQTTRVIAYEDPYYTWSYVGFGVRWDLTVEKTQTVLQPDAVVIDYGKAVQVDVLANDPVREGYTKEIVGFVKYDANADLTIVQQNPGSATYTADNGTFSIKDGKVQFDLTGLLSEVQRVFYVVKYTPTDETQAHNFYYVWGQLDIIPATMMYYETNFATGVFNNNGWNTEVNTTSNDSADGPQNAVAIGSSDIKSIYGYDSTYTNDAGLSNATSLYVEGEGLASTYTTFTFTGTGFDIISGTGPDQGLIKVVVTDASGNEVKTISVLNKSESDLTLYQIPVVSVNGLDHGTYTVKIAVDKSFTNTTDNAALDVLNRGNQFFYDAVRIYDPIDVSGGATAAEGTDEAVAFAAYTADGEADNEISEVRAMLIDANMFDVEGDNSGIVFVDKINDATGTEGADIATYATIGPNNEVYLVGAQAIGFYIDIPADNIPASIHIGAKSADGKPVVLSAVVDDTTVSNSATFEISSSTSLYYDIMGGNVATGADKLYVYVSNEGEGILSITDIKVAYGSAGTGTVSIGSDAETLEKTISNVEKRLGIVQEAANYDVISAEFAEESIKKGKTATLVITTPEAVESITVTNSFGRTENITVVSTELVDGVKVWTVTLKIAAVGTKTFSATGYSADGLAGASADATIQVTIR